MEDLNSERDSTLLQSLNRSSFWFVMLADRNCLEMLEKLSDGKVHRIDEIRTELHLSIPEMARVTSALLKTALIKETGNVSQHHTYRITDLGLACLPKLREGWPQEA